MPLFDDEPELEDFFQQPTSVPALGRLARLVGRELVPADVAGAAKMRRAVASRRDRLAETEVFAHGALIALSELCSGYSTQLEANRYQQEVRETREEPMSIRILKRLQSAPLASGKIAEQLDSNESTVSRALTRLLNASFVELTRGSDRRRHIYQLSIAGHAELARHAELSAASVAASQPIAKKGRDDEDMVAPGKVVRLPDASLAQFDWAALNHALQSQGTRVLVSGNQVS